MRWLATAFGNAVAMASASVVFAAQLTKKRMEEDVRATVRELLTNYLESHNSRKTPERYAILDAAYSIGGCFTMEELVAKLAEMKFLVSRATLYNAMRLFIELRLVIRHRFQTGTKYEACYANGSHCHIICTVCGRIVDTALPDMDKAFKAARMKRFRKDCYSLYVYGVCSSCQYRMKHNKRILKK